MKTKHYGSMLLVLISVSGCTSFALRHNTVNQAKTVRDFLADEVLYNLALYHEFYVDHDSNNFNLLPTFIRLNSGSATVTQTLNGQLALKYTATTEKDPQVSGMHATADNWSFIPVTDPNELRRLHTLYRALFETNISSSDLRFIFPTTDSSGHPFLTYTARTDTNGNVVLSNNSPVFDAKVKVLPSPSANAIPGAKAGTNWWFSFGKPPPPINAYYAGWYSHSTIWITDPKGFFDFAILALGGSNAPSGMPSPGTVHIDQNGYFLFGP